MILKMMKNMLNFQVTPPQWGRFRVLALTATLLCSGCAGTPLQDEAALLAAIPVAKLERAAALEMQGKPADAAALYLSLAAKVSPPARTQLQLKAARAYLVAGQTQPAQQTLNALAAQQLPAPQRALLQLTQAELALLHDHPQEAIALLKRLPVKALAPTAQQRRLGILAAAQRLAHAPLAAVKTLDVLDQYLQDPNERLLNQVSLLSTLNLLDATALRVVLRKGSSTLKSWAEIALLTQQTGTDVQRLVTDYRQWRQTHPRHRALPGLARAYAALLSGGYAPGAQVTVLLPRSGRFAGAAAAIKAGIVAAQLADDAALRPTLTFAESADDKRLRHIQAQALADGVDYVIGPLQKEAVDTLLLQGALPVPTLALNEATQTERRADNLFQLSLSPENEAVEVANKAYAQGQRRALVLFPNDAWGERLAQAFVRRWTALGGSLSGQARYPADTPGAAPVKTLLAGSAGELLFLVATADTVHQLYPQLREAAPQLRVLSTSHVYSGEFDSLRDAGLAGLCFVDIPWMFADDSASANPLARRRLTKDADPLARLYAMGIDAYRLAPRLLALAKNPGGYYPGQIGGLSLDQVGRVQRQLELGCFTSAGVVAAGTVED